MLAFDRRLKTLLVVFACALLVLVVRLVEMQIVRGDYYRRKAEQAFLLRPRTLPFVRGSILEHSGEVLVSEEPSWDVTIDFEIIAADVGDDAEAMQQAVRRWRRRYPEAVDDSEREQSLRAELSATWRMLAGESARTGRLRSVEELRAEARDIFDRVRRVRAAVGRRRGFDSPVAEEQAAHTILARFDAQAQVAARELIEAYPWLHLEAGSTRVYAADATPFAHLLGRVGRVDADAVANDPNEGDPFAAYRADERLGTSGVEYAAEGLLRGRRGEITVDREGKIISEIEAEHGRNVVLSIDGGLQRRLYDLMERAVAGSQHSSGGALVVLDAATREVRALVSYPAYDPARFDELYGSLRDDTERLPLWFRAVGSRYAPGSTVKPLACLAGLISGKITVDTRYECTGFLFPDVRDRWRCWQMHGTNQRMAHGSVDITAALTGSCNIFMYHLGEAVGVDGLCSVFDMVGVGRTAGTGLREEDPGINPTSEWLQTQRHTSAGAAHARLFAMGQGELSMTPLQVANLMATYATGRFRQISLLQNAPAGPEWRLPVSAEQWHAVRQGIFGVVNDPGGTAYQFAHFEHPGFVLCGKTGSATAYPWPTHFRIKYRDAFNVELEAVVAAGTSSAAVERFAAEHPDATFDADAVEAARHWPMELPDPGEGRHAHAWFGGFLQPARGGRPDWSAVPTYAFAVLVEFGGSGGRTTGPLAKEIAGVLAELPER